MRTSLLIAALLLSACSASPADNSQLQNHALQPYLTSTLPASPTPNVLVIVETPQLTETPFVYIIQSGDTLSQIAEKFKVAQNDLQAANPDVDANSMSVGATLVIPNPSTLANGSTPTPLPAPITQGACHASADSGLWCFALVRNDSAQALENVSVLVNLLDEGNNIVASQTAFPLLDIIHPNSSLPAYVYFANISANVTPQFQLLSAMQSSGAQYLPAMLNNAISQVAWDGRTAQLSGQIYLPAESQPASTVWVAATAYDKYGQVVGVKRWEGGAIQPGTSISFSFSAASLGSAIETVDFAVQANP